MSSTDGGRRAGWLRSSGTAEASLFVALAVALGYLLVSVPNVELITFTVFASGVALGLWRGALVGAVSMAIYSGANPVGSGLALPTLFTAQVIASAAVGLAGGLASPFWRSLARARRVGGPGDGDTEAAPGRARAAGRAWRSLVAGATGLVLTLVYQLAVIAGVAAASPEFRTGAAAMLVSNALFFAVHLVSNTVIFAVLAPAVLPKVIGFSRSGGSGGGTRPAPESEGR
jgi:hypothetical protein